MDCAKSHRIGKGWRGFALPGGGSLGLADDRKKKHSLVQTHQTEAGRVPSPAFL